MQINDMLYLYLFRRAIIKHVLLEGLCIINAKVKPIKHPHEIQIIISKQNYENTFGSRVLCKNVISHRNIYTLQFKRLLY